MKSRFLRTNLVNILVIDHCVETVASISSTLGPSFCQVVSVSSFDEAIELLSSVDFALVLMSGELCAANDHKTTSVIKTLSKNTDTPIIYMSGNHDDITGLIGTHVSGSFDCILKPLDPIILKAKVIFFIDLYWKWFELKEENARLKDALQRSFAIGNNFLSVVSHELNTPITSLKLQLQMMQKSLGIPKDGAVQSNYFSKGLEVSCKQVERLISVTRTLMDCSYIESGRFLLHPERFKLQYFLDDIIEKHSDLKDCSGRKINICLNEDLEVNWDKERIAQILTKLISNSVRFAPGEIDLSAQESDGIVILEIRDYGMGIQNAMREGIFDRLEWSRVENASGLGFGFYIVKGIIEAHKGQVDVKSEPSGGTTFSIYLRKDLSYHLNTDSPALVAED